MRTRVKICGITRVGDALEAVAQGADAIGLVFYEQSPRCVSPDRARAIARALPPFVTVVGLFVDAPAERVRELWQQVPLGLVQLHGEEDPAYCRALGLPHIKALRMRPGVDLAAAERDYADSRGLLADSYSPAGAGGTGRVFDWDLIPATRDKPLILAGGLDAGNVAAAIARVRPYAVDVSSGVERDKGTKDAAKIAAFMNEVMKQV